MAYWNGKRIIYWETKICSEYPNWEVVDCGCYNGLKWGGEYPNECKYCEG